MEKPGSPYSQFRLDLQKEAELGVFLDKIYLEKFDGRFTVRRCQGKTEQKEGIDLIITDQISGKKHLIDEKAQLDYINKTLPTFAFELDYLKSQQWKKGWLFDPRKRTDRYFLITSIQVNATAEIQEFISCRVTSVHRQGLQTLLERSGLSEEKLMNYAREIRKEQKNGKTTVLELDAKTQGYLYFSGTGKAEQPVNLVLRLAYLEASGVAKVL